MMKSKYLKAVLLGVIAGMRSLSAPALASVELEKSRLYRAGKTGFSFLNAGIFPLVTRVMAVGEFFGDKLPSTPNRTAPAPLVFRILSGAFSGAAICSIDENSSTTTGAVLGAAAAAASTFAFYYLRRTIVQKLKLPDTTVALVEDGLVAAAGRLVAD